MWILVVCAYTTLHLNLTVGHYCIEQIEEADLRETTATAKSKTILNDEDVFAYFIQFQFICHLT